VKWAKQSLLAAPSKRSDIGIAKALHSDNFYFVACKQ
jgi:hypothetical protein